jgi:hypothetical protein
MNTGRRQKSGNPAATGLPSDPRSEVDINLTSLNAAGQQDAEPLETFDGVDDLFLNKSILFGLNVLEQGTRMHDLTFCQDALLVLLELLWEKARRQGVQPPSSGK